MGGTKWEVGSSGEEAHLCEVRSRKHEAGGRKWESCGRGTHERRDCEVEAYRGRPARERPTREAGHRRLGAAHLVERERAVLRRERAARRLCEAPLHDITRRLEHSGTGLVRGRGNGSKRCFERNNG